MAVYIIKRHMVGGSGHEHIAQVAWEDRDTRETGKTSREGMVKFIEVDKGDARVDNGRSYVQVGVVDATPKYLRTHADRVWTDNLLALPEY